jgi:site-specific DNA-methyltransferase (adenine-specific)
MANGKQNPYAGKAAPVNRNHHPTVKPTALMRWLVRLVTPPGGVVLDPFMGSGSTGKACAKEGFRFVGIELDAEYFDIACRRIEDAMTGGPLLASLAKPGGLAEAEHV